MSEALFHTENTNQAAALVTLGVHPKDVKKVQPENGKPMVKFFFGSEKKEWTFNQVCEAWDSKDLDNVTTDQVIEKLLACKDKQEVSDLLVKYSAHIIKWTFFNRTKLGEMINKGVTLKMITRGSLTYFIPENSSPEDREKFLKVL